jgi:hypothetical protein
MRAILSLMIISPTPTTHVTLDLLAWHESGNLELSPKFQRRPVWKLGAKSYFIDSLLNGYPVPPLHVRLGMNKRGTAQREIIDGQQRLRAVFDFVNGKYRLSRSLEAPWAGRSFAELEDDDANNLKMYKFHAFQYDAIEDGTVLEIFARINNYSVGLNKQELRNGKFFGVFKNTVYEISRARLALWRDNRLFTETGIARMLEVEFVSELAVLLLDGVQDKKASLDSFYNGLDEQWGRTAETWTFKKRQFPRAYMSRDETVARLDAVLDHVVEIGGELIPSTEFHRIPLFYALFAVVAHHMYGLPELDLPSPRRRFTDSEAIDVRDAILRLSDVLGDGGNGIDDLPQWQREFLIASSRQTDNLAPRVARIETIWSQANLAHA